MEFRPCIDIHNGKVKQIVGSSLRDSGNSAEENFVSGQDAAYFAKLYKKLGIKGGHIILLNAAGSEYYEATREQAFGALAAYPGGMQIGGGITAQNGADFIRAGASHVIVTSYVLQNGEVHYGNLEKMAETVGSRHLVLDVSCRKTREGYIIVTDRWQKETREKISEQLLDRLSSYCDEFLIHAVDVEGRGEGIETELVKLLGEWGKRPVTYAGGVHDFDDLKKIKEYGKNKLNVTVGSALDLFGGPMKLEEVLEYTKNPPIK